MNDSFAAPSNQSDASRPVHRIITWADRPAPPSPPLSWLHQLTRIILIVIREMPANRLGLRTGALTYALLLSMVPLLAMSTAVVKGLGGGDQLREIVHAYLDTLEQNISIPATVPESDPGMPPAELRQGDGQTAADPVVDLTGHLRAAADRVFNYVDQTSFATLGTFGILGVFLSVILVLSQIETAMNVIWHVQDSRSLLRKVADYLTLMVLLPIAINVALAAGTLLSSQSLGKHLDRIIPAAWVQSLLLGGVPILFLTAALYVAYIFFPNTKVKNVPILIGALLAGTLWFATQNLFIGLQIGVAKYNAIYGSFASVPLFLIWIYFGWLFVLLGAQVAYAIQHQGTYRLLEKPSEPSLQLSAAFDICATLNERFAGNLGTTVEDITTAHPYYRPDLIEATRDVLIAAGMVHHSRETGELMPSGPPGGIDYHRLIEIMLGTQPPDTAGGRKAARVVAAALTGLPEAENARRADEAPVNQAD